MAIRGFLFDFDGLILDTETPVLTSWQELYRDHGHELSLDEWATIVGTVGLFDPFDRLDELAGPLDRAMLLARRRERELSLLAVEELRPGVLDYVEHARRHGISTAIVSSSSRGWVDEHLRRLEQAEHFDAVVTADRDLERSKPQPTLYLEALDVLGLAPQEAVAFEDSPNGVRAAKAAGIYCVAVPNGVTESLGLGGADLVVRSLAELPVDELLRRAASDA